MKNKIALKNSCGRYTGTSYGFVNSTAGDNSDINNESTWEYRYDKNGNMYRDDNKGISNIYYNYLNLPVQIFMGSNILKYGYDAGGAKLRFTNSGNEHTEYIGPFVYSNNGNAKTLSYILTGEGRALPDGNYFDYEYHIHDHLGNTRVVFQDLNDDRTIDPVNEVIQTADYYPFGMMHYTGTGLGDQRYLYNGKELQEGTEWYDYGARMYDPSLGRWQVIDLCAEENLWMTPFNYCSNSPINRIDPDGMLDDGYIIDEGGYIQKVDDTGGEDYDVLYTKKDYEEAKISGKVNVDGNPEPEKQVKVNDTDILPNLSAVDVDGNSISKSHTTGSIDDLFKVFKFAADNSQREWGLARYQYNKYAVYTSHMNDEIDLPDKDMKLQDVYAFIHNHPSAYKTEWKERSSMGDYIRPDTHQHNVNSGTDWWSKRTGSMNYEFYAYFSHTDTKRLYHIGINRVTQIRNINTYRDFYFGVLNHR